jgi:hypothetical protein
MPKRESLASQILSEDSLEDIIFWSDLYIDPDQTKERGMDISVSYTPISPL